MKKAYPITCIGERSIFDQKHPDPEHDPREWRTEHCLNCLNMRKDICRDPWGNPGNTYCKAYKDFLGRGVWMFVLTVGCKAFKKDPRKDTKL